MMIYESWRRPSDISLDFHEYIRAVAWKYLMYFTASINTKQFWNISKEKYFSPLRILSLSINSFVYPFVDIALTFFHSLLNLFLLS